MAFRMRSGSRPSRTAGVTYFGILVLVALIGLSLALAAPVVSSAMQRDNEQQLLWVGHAYRLAIENYYRTHGRFPPDLAALLADPTGTLPAHYLRALYPDPMTGGGPWILLKGPDGGVMGVASAASKAPIKVARFDEEDVDFDKAATYADWKFVYDPNAGAKKYGPSVFGVPHR
ncbi:MAG: type II secretion system protein [Pseudomonadota bacterium]